MSNTFNHHWDTFFFRLKRHFIEVLKTKTSDRSIALGYAIGTFIAILPTPGFSAFIGIAVVAIFKKINKISLFLALAIWNPSTLIPLYWLSIEIGNRFFENQPVILFRFELINQIFEYSRRFFVGNLIVSVPFFILSYYMALWVLRKVRTSRVKRTEVRNSTVKNIGRDGLKM